MGDLDWIPDDADPEKEIFLGSFRIGEGTRRIAKFGWSGPHTIVETFAQCAFEEMERARPD